MKKDKTVQYSEIQKQHALLRKNVALLRAAASAGPSAPPETQLRDQLAQGVTLLHETLRTHFALEEEGGYLEPVTTVRPGLNEAVLRLRQQHAEILGALARLEARFQAGASLEDTRTTALDILELLGNHELEETDLIQQVLLEDLGAGD